MVPRPELLQETEEAVAAGITQKEEIMVAAPELGPQAKEVMAVWVTLTAQRIQ